MDLHGVNRFEGCIIVKVYGGAIHVVECDQVDLEEESSLDECNIVFHPARIRTIPFPLGKE